LSSSLDEFEVILTGYALGPALLQKAREAGVRGTFVIELPSLSTIRAIAGAGLDFVVIDTEHSVFGFQEAEPLVLCAQALGMVALVRVWGRDEGLIGKALETGANGVLVPHVETLERAHEVVRETRFPPIGQRSYSPLLRYDALGQSKARLEESTVVIVQIEGRDGLAAAEKIASLDGIDGIFIGTHDLSMSLGVGPEDEKVFDAASALAGRLPHRTVKGVYLDRVEHSARWAAAGYGLQCISFDGRLLADAARPIAKTLASPGAA
jgi:2-keto-3-deoxy-L-rhamnonate aldolase RhmA